MDTTTVVVAVIGAVGIIVSPALLAYFTGRQRRAEKVQDWARQDEVAARVRDVAAVAAKTDRVVNDKLDTIHDLVNSNMTAAKRGELDARRARVVLMREILALHATSGRPATAAALAAIEEEERMITDLAAEVEDRLTQVSTGRHTA